jgi:hypothetical protein
MPWCDSCSRYYAPNAMPVNGTCPSCGQAIAEAQDQPAKAPWHFKLLVVAAVIYLGWRLIQGVTWLAHHV